MRDSRLFRASCAVVMVLVTGCATGQGQDADPWQPAIEEALENSTSDFERGVLEDFTVTRAEYEEAHDLMVGCLQDAGFAASLQERYRVFQVTLSPGGEAADQALQRCERGTTEVIALLYNSMTKNPERRDWNDMVADCLVAEDLVPRDVTLEELRRSIEEDGRPPGYTEAMATCSHDPASILSDGG